MDDDARSDPAEQLKRIRQLRGLSTQRLTSLNTSIQHFMAKFDEQKADLTGLYQKTQDHQRVSENISAVRVRLQAIIDLLQTHHRLLPHITGNIEHTFDTYMNTMEEIKQGQIQLADHNFEDARKANCQLSVLQQKGQTEIVSYFQSILLQGSEALPETTFQLVGGNLEVTNADLRDHFIYPLSVEDFDRLSRMARVLDQMSGTVEHWDVYQRIRGVFLKKSLQPFFERSKKRVVSETPQDALDIATYTRFSHPVHLLARALDWLVDREKLIIQKIFPSGHAPRFNGTVDSAFSAFIKVVTRLTVPVLNSHIDCLFDLDLISTLGPVMLTFTPPDDERAAANDRQMVTNLSDRVKPLEKASLEILDSFRQLVEKHDLQFVPPTGSVSPLTSNVILFLIELSGYAFVGRGIPSGGIGGYATDVLKCLQANVQGKAKHYKDDIVLSNLFLMNNMSYAYTAIQESPLAKLVAAEVLPDIEGISATAQDHYMEKTWTTAAAKLRLGQKEQSEFGPLNAKRMTKKQRMTIKHQFRNFGQRVDEIISKHQGYHLKNAKLMATVYADAIKHVMPDYEKFWTFWKDRGFSKTPEKWISYQPATLAEMITRLYGQDRKKTS